MKIVRSLSSDGWSDVCEVPTCLVTEAKACTLAVSQKAENMAQQLAQADLSAYSPPTRVLPGKEAT